MVWELYPRYGFIKFFFLMKGMYRVQIEVDVMLCSRDLILVSSEFVTQLECVLSAAEFCTYSIY